MLVLSRKKDERIQLRCPRTGAVIAELCVVGIDRNKVRLGIAADRQLVSIDRLETVGPTAG